MSAPDSGSIIVFDGDCVLCNGWVRFLIRRDPARRFRFAAMRSDAGRALLGRHGLDPRDPASFLLVDECGAWTETRAITRLLAGLGAGWHMAALAIRAVPAGLRDAAYRRIARDRYRWFGRHDHCHLPAADEHERFLS